MRLLGTSYSFSHRLTFTPTSIIFSKIPMRDDEGHTGIVDGVIRHRFFGDFDLDLTASEMRGVKVLQTATKQALPIYGTAYGTGMAQMKGKLPKLLLDVNLRSALVRTSYSTSTRRTYVRTSVSSPTVLYVLSLRRIASPSQTPSHAQPSQPRRRSRCVWPFTSHPMHVSLYASVAARVCKTISSHAAKGT